MRDRERSTPSHASAAACAPSPASSRSSAGPRPDAPCVDGAGYSRRAPGRGVPDRIEAMTHHVRRAASRSSRRPAASPASSVAERRRPACRSRGRSPSTPSRACLASARVARGAGRHRRRGVRRASSAPSAARRSRTASPATSTARCAQAAAEARRRWPQLVGRGAVRRPAGAAARGPRRGAGRRCPRAASRSSRTPPASGTTLLHRAVRRRSTRASARARARRTSTPGPSTVGGRLASLRRDVDTADDLAAARALGRRAAHGRPWSPALAEAVTREAAVRLLPRRLAASLAVGQDLLAVFLAGDFLAVAFFAGAFLARRALLGRRSSSPAPSWRSSSRSTSWPAAFLAGAFFAVVFLAGDFLAPAPSWRCLLGRASSWRSPSSPSPSSPTSSRPCVFLVVAALGGRFLAAAAVRDRGLGAAALPADAARVSFGSFLAPETTALRSAPALNFGTAVFLAFIRSPVRGVAHPAGVADLLLEGAEPGDRDLLALGDLAGDGVEHRVERVSGRLAVALVASRQGVDQLTLVHKLPFRERPGRAPCSTTASTHAREK